METPDPGMGSGSRNNGGNGNGGNPSLAVEIAHNCSPMKNTPAVRGVFHWGTRQHIKEMNATSQTKYSNLSCV
jgi:hypothetical protein